MRYTDTVGNYHANILSHLLYTTNDYTVYTFFFKVSQNNLNMFETFTMV